MAASAISPANTGEYSYLVSRDYSDIFFNEYMKWPAHWSQIAKVTSSDGNYEKEAVLSPLGQFETIGEGGATRFDVPEQGHAKTWYHTKFGKGFMLTEEMQDDDKSRHMGKMGSASLAQSALWKQEVQFFDLINSGWDTHTCADAFYIFDTSRTLLKAPGTTWANTPASQTTLSLTTLEAGLQHFDDLVNQVGMPMQMRGKKILLIPTALRWLAKELTKSELKPDTANNNINPVYDEDLTFMVTPWITTSTYWVLIVQGQHDMRFVWRKKLAFKAGDDFNTGNAMFKATQRFSNVCLDARGVYGSQGTA